MNSVQQPIHFKIRGMDCSEEVEALKQSVGPLVGGPDNLAFDILNSKMTVLTPAAAPPEVILKAVQRAGMSAEPWTKAREPSEEKKAFSRTVLTVLSGALATAGFLTHVVQAGGFSEALGAEGIGVAHQVPVLAKVLYAAAIIAGIWHVLPKTWLAARRLRPDMNLLMTLAVSGAVGIGEWFEAATVSFLFALSLALEAWSVGRARRAVEALLELAPSIVRLRKNGTEELVSPDSVAVGSVFLVKPGERIPLDGTVVQGASHVNQAPITGESIPVLKEAGAPIFAGTINGDGALVVRSAKPAGETTLAQILRLVAESQGRRSPSEQWVEKFARIYTPVVFASALAVAIGPPLFLGADWTAWLYRSLVLLVIGCPCALVISTPVSMVASLAASARNGVLVKGGRFIEAAAHLRAVALDKTGTVSQGNAVVVRVVPVGEHREAEVIERAAALENHSDHPLAQAIVKYARDRQFTLDSPEDFQIVQGKGAQGLVNGNFYWVGSHRYLEERGQETPEAHRMLEELSQAGRSVVVVGTAEHVCGYISIADPLRPEARQAVLSLRQAGVKHIVMLTGDNQPTAERVAEEAGIDEFRAELLPVDKVTVVDQLVSKYGSVAMVGDGINDAPAMGRASLGIAMAAAGTDAAIEAADVALMSDDLSKLPWLIRHARRMLAIIRQNVILSLAVKAAFVALTFAGAASLWMAIAADMGVTLAVISNALRLLKISSTRL